jgi:hypothetical protein
MADNLAAEELRPFEIGTTLSTAFTLMGSYPLIVFGVSLILGALPTRLLAYAASGPTSQTLAAASGKLLPSLGEMVLQIIVGGMLTGTALIVAQGDKADAVEALRPGVHRLIPLILVGFLYTLGCVIGLCALLVPFFFLWIRWSVVGSVVVAEDIGISAAFGRSSELTNGSRLRILGLLILSGLIQGLFAVLITLLVMPLAGLSTQAADLAANPAAITVQALMETLIIGFTGSVQCALYIELKQRRDGPLTDQLSAIFA